MIRCSAFPCDFPSEPPGEVDGGIYGWKLDLGYRMTRYDEKIVVDVELEYITASKRVLGAPLHEAGKGPLDLFMSLACSRKLYLVNLAVPDPPLHG